MKKFFRFLVCAVVALGVSSALWAAGADKLVASKNSDKYHLASCAIAAQISADNKVTFATPEEAIAAKYAPCKKCNPPTQSFIASKKSDKYHLRSCAIGKKIAADNSVVFLSETDAQKAGYKPCQLCLAAKKDTPSDATKK